MSEAIAEAPWRHIKVEPLAPSLGAEVRGVDLAAPTETQLMEIKAAWAQHLVLTFPEQRLDREAPRPLAGLFGTLHVHPLNHARGGDDEILVVKTDAESKYTAGTRGTRTFPATPSRPWARRSTLPKFQATAGAIRFHQYVSGLGNAVRKPSSLSRR